MNTAAGIEAMLWSLPIQPRIVAKCLRPKKSDLTGVDGREVVMGVAEIAPGVAAGKLLHHGTEIGYVLEGSVVLEVEGEAPRSLTAGESYQVDLRRPHDAKNTGTTPLKVLAIYVVEKGKPLAEPVK